jgi:hypothetical protein
VVSSLKITRILTDLVREDTNRVSRSKNSTQAGGGGREMSYGTV